MAIAIDIWMIIRAYIDYFIDYIFSLYYNSTRQYIPRIKNALLLESATSIARKIRNKEIKSENIVKLYIERIQQVNSVLNAVIDDCFDKAIEEAKKVDNDIDSGKIAEEDFINKPFLGVPFTTKASTACKGLSNTFGLVCRKGITAKEDADIVMLMKNAGGILIAVTNVPQLNLWQEATNPINGKTNNPYDTTRTAGGSSGGEASIIAACGSPIGIGTDIGGSIRIPCFMCGIFGHKCSPDITLSKGLTFRDGTETDSMLAVGPMARHAEDLIPLFKVVLGKYVNKLKLDEKVDTKSINIYYITESRDLKVSTIRPEMKAIFMRVVKHFNETQNSKPQVLDIPDVKYGGKLWRYWMSQEKNADFNSQLMNYEGSVNPTVEILKYFIGQSEFNLPTILNLINGLLPKENEEWAVELTKNLQKAIKAKLGDNGVLLYPSGPWPASYHNSSVMRPWNLNYFAIWNALKMPVTQIPLGLNSEGLPLGIQVVAAPYQDHLCLAIAKELESAFGGFVPPCEVED